MARAVTWTRNAQSDLRAIERSTALRILHALARLVQAQEGDVKRLQAIDPPEYRLRVGDYRVRFRDHEDRIEVLTVKNRSEAYR